MLKNGVTTREYSFLNLSSKLLITNIIYVMKKTTIMIKTLIGAFALTLFLGTTSCKNETKVEDTKEIAEDQNEAKFEENNSKEDDAEFLVAAAETDLMEIEIGKLAMSRSTDNNVKEFAKTLVADHTKSAEETKPFAQRLNVTIPMSITEKGKEHYNDLNDKKTAKEFDEKFAELMVKGHEDAVSKMEKAADKANDPEVKAWAAGMVPTLKAHLEHAKTLEDQVKNRK